MPANGRWDLIQRLKFKIVKNPGNGRLNNLNDPVLNVLRSKKESLEYSVRRILGQKLISFRIPEVPRCKQTLQYLECHN
jgi:hypothetical protein